MQQQFAVESIIAVTSYLKDINNHELSLETKQETVQYINACVRNDRELLTVLSNGSLDSRPDSASWFASFYHAQGRYDEAEKLFERALAGKEEKLGPKHPDTLRAVENLANFFGKQGRLDEVRSLRERVEIIRAL
jgi:tetratricopeptide (TPR) repeat protein